MHCEIVLLLAHWPLELWHNLCPIVIGGWLRFMPFSKGKLVKFWLCTSHANIWCCFYFFGLLYFLPNAVQWYHNVVNFLQNPNKRHPVAHPLGWAMGCLVWIQTLINILTQSLHWPFYVEPCYHSTRLYHITQEHEGIDIQIILYCFLATIACEWMFMPWAPAFMTSGCLGMYIMYKVWGHPASISGVS